MDAVEVDEERIIDHVTDLQQSQTAQSQPTPDERMEATGVQQNGELPLTPTSPSDAPSETPLEAVDLVAEQETAIAAAAAAATTASGADESSATGLATPAAKRRRYRNLFGNIGKLITFSRRRQEQPASPSAATELAETELQFPPAEPISLDLIVPEAEALGGGAEDPITGQLELLEPLETAPVTKETADEVSELIVEESLLTSEADYLVEETTKEEPAESPDVQQESLESPEELEEAKEKKKMEYDMSLGGISTILEETEEAVKAQETERLTEEELIQLESEIDLADYDSQRPVQKSAMKKAAESSKEVQPVKERGEVGDAKQMKEEPEGKASRVVALQNQISESDSGYGYSTTDSPIEDKSEKPHSHADEVEGSSGCSDVFSKDLEDSQNTRHGIKSDALISPSDEELASFEKAEVCVEDSMVDLGEINVKLDSLIESNNPEKLSHQDEKPAPKPDYHRVCESLEDEDDEEIEPVELDLSSNQSVRRRQILEAKVRRQKELDAARRLQEEALGCLAPAEECKRESPVTEDPVKDKDIVDGLGPRRHSHENNSCAESCSEGGRSRMRSRLPVRRSASCPRRTVEEYSTYIRTVSAAKKPISHLIESGYSPVKIDFKPLSRAGQEAHGEHLTASPQPGAGSGQTGKRGGKKVHFNSPTVDQVVTYATADSDEMKHRDSEENGQQVQQKARGQVAGVSSGRSARLKAGDADKSVSQHDRSVIKAISVKQTLASRKRLEKLHEDAVKQLGLQDDSQYMTPLQRKDLEVKELKRQLDEAYFVIEQRELELDVFHHEKTRSIEDAVKDREERIACLQVQINQLESDFSCLRAQHSEMCTREKSLAESLEQLKAECAERERRHQDLYLEMYRKGRDSARFERQDEIEKLAVLEPDKVAMEELLEKLEITQHDLQKWQSIKLKEVYEDSDKASTEADAKLRFLRDSMFHYLTEKDREQNQQHLMAMIGIFSFTDVQMKHIMKSLDERRRKGKL